ncbi:hypothetical protein RB213_003719 [Colletotrichum asianum]
MHRGVPCSWEHSSVSLSSDPSPQHSVYGVKDPCQGSEGQMSAKEQNLAGSRGPSDAPIRRLTGMRRRSFSGLAACTGNTPLEALLRRFPSCLSDLPDSYCNGATVM